MAAIAQARERLERRQRDADLERGHDPDEPPRGGRYKREFGVHEGQLHRPRQPHHEARRRGLRRLYNAQTAVDDAAHIIVAAELTNCASDAGELPTMRQSVKDTLSAMPEQALAETGCKADVVFGALA